MFTLRRLPLSELRNLAVQTKTGLEILKNEKRALHAKSKAAWKEAEAAGALLLKGEATTIFALDREADRVIGAFFRSVDALAALFTAQELPLDAVEEPAAKALAVISAALDGHDRTLVNLPVRQQWDAMRALRATAETPPVAAALTTVGLSAAVHRLARITDTYGARLGITSDGADGAEARQAAFETALEKALLATTVEHDGDSEDDRQVRGRLLAPYEAAVATDRASRASERRKKRTHTP